MPRMPEKTITIDSHDASLIRYALAQRLKAVIAETHLLKTAHERELNVAECLMLPSHMIDLSREKLVEQFEAWRSLADTLNYYIQLFTMENCDESPVPSGRSGEV